MPDTLLFRFGLGRRFNSAGMVQFILRIRCFGLLQPAFQLSKTGLLSSVFVLSFRQLLFEMTRLRAGVGFFLAGF